LTERQGAVRLLAFLIARTEKRSGQCGESADDQAPAVIGNDLVKVRLLAASARMKCAEACYY
jgi:hypothetical protein